VTLLVVWPRTQLARVRWHLLSGVLRSVGADLSCVLAEPDAVPMIS
jgi:hypothetical protein